MNTTSFTIAKSINAALRSGGCVIDALCSALATRDGSFDKEAFLLECSAGVAFAPTPIVVGTKVVVINPDPDATDSYNNGDTGVVTSIDASDPEVPYLVKLDTLDFDTWMYHWEVVAV